jgi:hypothetical protein
MKDKIRCSSLSKTINLVIILTITMCFVLINCSKKSDETTGSQDNSEQKSNPVLKHIVFRVRCESNNGLVLAVSIFDEATKKRMEYGNTLSNGGYCSVTMDARRSYRIELYKSISNSLKCIGIIYNVNIILTPEYWSDDCTAGYSASNTIPTYSFSSCTSFTEIKSSWGP